MDRNARTNFSESSSPRRNTSRFVGMFLTACLAVPSGIASAQQSSSPEPPTDEPLFSVDSPVGAIEYVTGRGLHLGHTGLTIGGFSTAEIDREEGKPASIELDGVNFLVLFEPFSGLRGFAEIEVGNILSIQTDGDTDSDPQVDVERLYGDLVYSDAVNARFGKFQTPVGRWNLVPAEPFVWTSSDPVMLETAFDEHQTGGALFGSLYPGSNTLSYWLYGQFLDPLDPSDDPKPADRTVGGRLEYGGAVGEWSLGSSFLAFERNNDWSYLGGLDGLLRVGPLELQSEFVLVEGDLPDRDQWGIFLQGVYGLGDLHRSLRKVYAVGRYEHFDPSGWSQEADIFDVGVAWLPVQFLNLKLGYRFTNHESDEVRRGLTASVSVLF
jgi:hypothetical protein